MSMICTVVHITDNDIKSLKENPKRVELLVNDGEYFEQPKKSFFQRIFSKDNPPTDTWKPKPEAQYELDKLWHVIHFILTNDPEGGSFPLNFLMSGGEEIGEDIGYGPIRVLNSTQVKELKSCLHKIPVSIFREKYNPDVLTQKEIYPTGIDWADETKDWVIELYVGLVEFVDAAAQMNKGIYVTIT